MAPPAISLVQLHYVLAAVDHASFAGAARQFNVKQSTLSRRIQALEEELGIALFERSTKGASPTEVGTFIAEAARTIIGQVNGLAKRAEVMRTGNERTVRIGYCGLLLAGQLKHMLADFLKQSAQHSILTQEGTPDTLIDALQAGKIDTAIIPVRASFEGLESRPLWSERLLAAIPVGHHLGKPERLYWHDIVRERLILSSRGIGAVLHSLLLARKTAGSDERLICLNDSSHEAALSVASIGNHISLTTDAALGIAWPGLSFCEIEGADGAARLEYRLYWNPLNRLPALSSLIALIASRYPA